MPRLGWYWKWGATPNATPNATTGATTFFKPYWYSIRIGPNEVRALPLGVAAERSVHYFWDYVLRIAF